MKVRYLILVGLLLASCDSASHFDDSQQLVCTQDPVPGVWLPLEIGNYWDIEASKGSGGVVDTFRTLITTKLDPEIYGIEDAYVAEEFSFSSPVSKTQKIIWKNEPNGLLLAGLIVGQDTVIANFRKYPFPASNGASFQSYVFRKNESGQLEVSDSTTWTVFTAGHLVNTSVRQFATTVFKYTRPQLLFDVSPDRIYEQVAAGVGFVARDWNRLEGYQNIAASFRHRLVDFCIKQPLNS